MSRPEAVRSTRRRRVVLGSLVAVVMAALAVVVLPVTRRGVEVTATTSVMVDRTAGTDRVDTAIRLAERSHPDGVEVAMLARADAFPDALAVAPLAGHLGAPVLLTPPDRLPGAVRDALVRLGVDRVFVLGGDGAIDDAVLAGLPSAVDVERIAGRTRHGTAAAVARRLDEHDGVGSVGRDRTALLATGVDFPDALAAGWPAALGGFPVLLTGTTSLPSETMDALDDIGIGRVILLGGPAAVSEGVAQALRDRGLTVARISGATRQDTAVAIAEWGRGVLPWPGRDVVLVRGDDFPDALAGGPYAAASGGPILLTRSPRSLGGATGAWLEARCSTLEVLHVLGGVAAVGDDVAAEAVGRAMCGPSPSPSPSPSGTPPPSGFPDADSTGVPAGVVLTVHHGNLTITTDGAVVEELDIRGCLRIRADDVTVRRTRVRGEPCDNRHQVDLGVGVTGAVLEDVEIDGMDIDSFGAGIGNVGYTCRRCDIHHVGVGANMVRDVVVEDSWIHDIHYANGSHNEAILSNGGSGFVVRGNRLDSNLEDGTSSALSLYGDFEQVRDALVERNLFNGGGFCVYAGSVDGKPYPVAANTRFLDNHFGRELTDQCGWYGPVTAYRAGNGNVWSGNVWHDTGAPVPAP